MRTTVPFATLTKPSGDEITAPVSLVEDPTTQRVEDPTRYGNAKVLFAELSDLEPAVREAPLLLLESKGGESADDSQTQLDQGALAALEQR